MEAVTTRCFSQQIILLKGHQADRADFLLWQLLHQFMIFFCWHDFFHQIHFFFFLLIFSLPPHKPQQQKVPQQRKQYQSQNTEKYHQNHHNEMYPEHLLKITLHTHNFQRFLTFLQHPFSLMYPYSHDYFLKFLIRFSLIPQISKTKGAALSLRNGKVGQLLVWYIFRNEFVFQALEFHVELVDIASHSFFHAKSQLYAIKVQIFRLEVQVCIVAPESDVLLLVCQPDGRIFTFLPDKFTPTLTQFCLTIPLSSILAFPSGITHSKATQHPQQYNFPQKHKIIIISSVQLSFSSTKKRRSFFPPTQLFLPFLEQVSTHLIQLFLAFIFSI